MAVYFVRNMVTGNIKIGVTDDPEKRFSELQTGNDCPLELLHFMPGDTKLEQSLHARFSGLRIRGEWFYDGNELLDFIHLAKTEPREAKNRMRRGRLTNTTQEPPVMTMAMQEEFCPCKGRVRGCVCRGTGRVFVPTRSPHPDTRVGWAPIHLLLRDLSSPMNMLTYVRNRAWDGLLHGPPANMASIVGNPDVDPLES